MDRLKGKVLVTGGAGFIGSHLCESLLEDGYEVICLDNFLTGRRENIEHLLGKPDFTLEERDVCKPFTYEVNFIFHMASPASPASYAEIPIETMMANSLGTANCLELAGKVGARLLLGSTSEVYGDPSVSPQNETYTGNVNPVGPRSCYDEGKRFAEALCKAYERERGTEIVIARIFNTYGPRMRKDDGRVIPNFVTQALAGLPITIYGDGNQTRSFCHVKDMVRGLKLAMFSEEAKGEVINLGNPHEMRIIDLANMVRKMVGSSSELEFEGLPADDPMMRKPDISKAMRILGWAPETGIDDGLKDVIEWFRERS